MSGLQRLFQVHLQGLRQAEGTPLGINRMLQRIEQPLLLRIAAGRILRPPYAQDQRRRTPGIPGRREVTRLRLDRIAFAPLEKFRIDRKPEAFLDVPPAGRTLVGPAFQHGLRRVVARGTPRRDNHIAHAIVIFRKYRKLQGFTGPDQAVAVVGHQHRLGMAIRLHLQNAARGFLLGLFLNDQQAILGRRIQRGRHLPRLAPACEQHAVGPHLPRHGRDHAVQRDARLDAAPLGHGERGRRTGTLLRFQPGIGRRFHAKDGRRQPRPAANLDHGRGGPRVFGQHARREGLLYILDRGAPTAVQGRTQRHFHRFAALTAARQTQHRRIVQAHEPVGGAEYRGLEGQRFSLAHDHPAARGQPHVVYANRRHIGQRTAESLPGISGIARKDEQVDHPDKDACQCRPGGPPDPARFGQRRRHQRPGTRHAGIHRAVGEGRGQPFRRSSLELAGVDQDVVADVAAGFQFTRRALRPHLPHVAAHLFTPETPGRPRHTCHEQQPARGGRQAQQIVQPEAPQPERERLRQPAQGALGHARIARRPAKLQQPQMDAASQRSFPRFRHS